MPPTLVTRKMLVDSDIKNMDELSQKLPQFAKTDVAKPDWMPIP